MNTIHPGKGFPFPTARKMLFPTNRTKDTALIAFTDAQEKPATRRSDLAQKSKRQAGGMVDS